MTQSERWARIEPILDTVFDLSPEERAVFLDRECAGDTSLRKEIEELVRASSSESFLEKPAGDFASGLVAAETRSDEIPNVVTGPYRLISEIARGGMGSVYLAERADGQFEQRVALKLIKRGMDSDEVNRRFLSERRILARLSHPNIARLFDGGMTSHGQPWFAMELVDGLPITRYVEQNQSTVSERIHLFDAVCEAVRYAHQNLVVHRDLKPSNIMVTREGNVKLLDFGIAKVLADEVTDSPATLTELRLMTPEYASPEQVRGDPVTTATDVYALGAVLYEILSGQRAHQFERRTTAEIERVVCETDPAAPSSVVAHRDRVLARQIAGDLDTIVLKAMHKDPARRYQSAEAFHEDLRRYETGLPVTARPDTIQYRARKFVRRYRVLVTGAAAVFVTLMAGLAGTLWQTRAASRQASIASAEAAKALEVKNFVVNLFKANDPTGSQRGDITAREVLQRGSEQVDTALSRQPEVQAELLDVLGVLNYELGLLPQADTLLKRSITLSTELHGSAHPQVLERQHHRARVLSTQSRFEEAEAILREVLRTRRLALGPDHIDVAAILSDLGIVLYRKGNLPEAEALLRDAVAINRKQLGPDALQVAEALSSLATALGLASKRVAADSAVDQALAIEVAKLGEGHPRVLQTLHTRAVLRVDQGKYDEAKAIERKVLEGRLQLFGPDNLITADAMSLLGVALDFSGASAEAESLYIRALAINRKTLGEEHPSTIKVANNLAVLRYRMRDLDGAEESMRLARGAWIRTLGEDHVNVITSTNNLGAILSDLGKYKEAEPLLRDALGRRMKQFGDSSSEVAQSWRNLGLLLYRTRRFSEAEPVFRMSLRNFRALYGPEHPRVADAQVGLGMVLTDVGRLGEAESVLRDALAIRLKAFKPGDARLAEVRGALGQCLLLRGKRREAESLLRESLRAYRADGRDKPAIAKAEKRLMAFSSAPSSQ